MAVDVCVEAIIARRVTDVASYCRDPSNAPAWYRRIDSARWLSGPPLGTGTRVQFSARFLGRRLTYTYEIVEDVPGHRLVMRTSEGPFPMTTTYCWEASGDGLTRMTLRNTGQPGGFFRLTAPLVASAMRRAMRQDLRQLAAILEGR